MSNPMQDLHTLGLNPFSVTLLAESMLKSAYVKHCGTKPLTFEFPVSRGDCAGWAGVRITIEAVPTAAGVAAGPAPWEVKVHFSRGERTLRAGMQFRLALTGSTWELVEPTTNRIYSPSGLGGTPTFWCKPVDEAAKKEWQQDARGDGCVSFCGDSIAASLISTDGVTEAPAPDLAPVFQAFMTAAQEIIDHNVREMVSDWLTRAWHHRVLPKLKAPSGVKEDRQ